SRTFPREKRGSERRPDRTGSKCEDSPPSGSCPTSSADSPGWTRPSAGWQPANRPPVLPNDHRSQFLDRRLLGKETERMERKQTDEADPEAFGGSGCPRSSALSPPHNKAED